METTQMFFANFHVLGSAIACVFTLLGALFLFTIPNRSKASFHLGMGLLSMGVLTLGFLFTYSTYDSVSAFHRWLTVGAVFPAAIHTCQFLFNFPEPWKPKLARVILIVQYAAYAVIFGLFIFKSLSADRIYFF